MPLCNFSSHYLKYAVTQGIYSNYKTNIWYFCKILCHIICHNLVATFSKHSLLGINQGRQNQYPYPLLNTHVFDPIMSYTEIYVALNLNALRITLQNCTNQCQVFLTFLNLFVNKYITDLFESYFLYWSIVS